MRAHYKKDGYELRISRIKGAYRVEWWQGRTLTHRNAQTAEAAVRDMKPPAKGLLGWAIEHAKAFELTFLVSSSVRSRNVLKYQG